MANRPQTQFTVPMNLPAYVLANGRFCLWRYEPRKNKPNEWTKVPYQPKATQYGADSTNAAHFSDIDTALDAADGFDGVGLGIFGDVGAIDIDHCVSEAGELSLMAQTIMQKMDSYCEYSPSGRGIRILFLAKGFKYDTDKYYINNQGAKDKHEQWPEKQGVEVYIAGATSKFVTVTGNTITGKDLQERGKEVQEILDMYMKRAEKPTSAPAPAPAPPSVGMLSDNELLEIAAKAKNGAQFVSLYRYGDIGSYPSHSEADQALMNLLCFYAAGDIPRMVRMFKASALFRPDKSGKDKYLERTAQKAVRDCTTYYTPAAPKVDPAPQKAAKAPEPAPATTAQSVDAFLAKARSHDFEPIPTGYKTIDNAIGGGFVRQTLVLMGAAPAAGKTIFAQQIFENIAKEGRANVVYINLEMSVEQLLARSLSRDVEYSSLTILQGYRWTPQQAATIEEAAQRYKKEIAPRIKYNVCPSANYRAIVDSLTQEAEALLEAGDTRPLCVIIDYLQLLQGDGLDSVETIKYALKDLKDFAVKYNAVVFAIMAHSRAANTSGAITQAAGRDTSALEYSGDLMLSLNRADENGDTLDNEKKLQALTAKISHYEALGGTVEANKLRSYRKLTVTKNRFGAEFTSVNIRIFGEHSKFVEYAPKSMDQQAPRRQATITI